ncbi:MAG TPA: hypothetical protein PKM44_13320 [Turneriella sp.]|nr:hypothetical protein [Turneriella sp.]HMY10312.1 hypothetical protein [Turneriella sp.]HNA79618.1 hypothetical protein [Turneriella sp.]HNE20539.1 hypothetical protein [Turneriella sp.]HNL11492.1 hypothetical protein [Turneriella sp.]
MKRTSIFALIAALSLLAANCRSRGPQIKAPRENLPATEFHHEPAKVIPWFYGNKSSRGLDRQADAAFFDQVGGGVGLLVNSRLDSQWDGHKFFYYYLDFDFSPQFNPGKTYPGDKQWIFSSYPGIMFRTYTPFYLKMHFGFGMNVRYNQQHYDRWGVYGMMGAELWGFTSTVVFIGHPGQLNWETEYRAGYMWAPVEWK